MYKPFADRIIQSGWVPTESVADCTAAPEVEFNCQLTTVCGASPKSRLPVGFITSCEIE